MGSQGPSLPSLLLPDLLPAVLHHEEGVGAVGHGEGEAVPERAAAVVAVAEAALVDVIHGEGGGLQGTLPTATELQQPVPGWLHHPERDGLHLCPDMEEKAGDTISEPGQACASSSLCPGSFPVLGLPALSSSLCRGGSLQSQAHPTDLLVQLT